MKEKMSWLQRCVVAYGVINILGGIMGLVMGKSTMSLLVGGGVGLALIILSRLASTKPAMAWRTIGMLTVALLVFWIYRYTGAEKKVMPMMNIALSAVMFGLLGYGHMSAQAKKKEGTS